MKYCMSSVCLFFLMNYSIAQITVSGRVVSGKESLPGAHIWKKSNYQINGVSDDKGYFKVAGLQLGDTLLCSFIGYMEKVILVSEPYDDILIEMDPFSQQLNIVEVKATVLGAENFAFEKLKPLDIYTNPNAKADALVAINTQMSSTTKR